MGRLSLSNCIISRLHGRNFRDDAADNGSVLGNPQIGVLAVLRESGLIDRAAVDCPLSNLFNGC